MLSVRHIPRTQIAISNKWISIVHNMVRLSSSSSSSDSSDSDSDLDTRHPKQTANIVKSNSNVEQKKDLDLYELIDHYMQKGPLKQVDIKINEKDKTELLEQRIAKAAEILTSSVGGDKEKIVSSLLFSLSAIKSKEPTKSTELTRESPRELKSEDAQNKMLKPKRLKTRTSNENKSTISKFKSYANERRTADTKMERESAIVRMLRMERESATVRMLRMERDSITERLLRIDEEQKKPKKPSIYKPLIQKQKKEVSISKVLLQGKTSVTEEPQSESSTQTKPPTPSIIKKLLKEKKKQSSTSKAVSQKRPPESSVIQQLQEQHTSDASLPKKFEESTLIKELLRKSGEEESQPPSPKEHQNQEKQPSVFKALLKDYYELRRSRQEKQEGQEGQEGQETRLQEPSISRTMLNQTKPRRSRFETRKPKRDYVKREAGVSPLHWILFDDDLGEEKRGQEDMSTYFKIFGEVNQSPTKTVELNTWNTCEEKYMKMIVKRYPENAFQEMAQWTEEGKMWNFPIDNEQGMDEEHNIHFSEHVFLDQHLAGWCPPKGPIRHFMELVCTGLSKNPYMAVQEKHDTIMWYREFFADKNDLLQKLGLPKIEKNVEKQAQLAQ